MAEEGLTLLSGDLKLEGRIHLPRLPGSGEKKLPGVVICHPHPLYGGDMNNNVVMALAASFSEQGIIAFRFNFRGVGLSEGVYDNGNGEKDDLIAAIIFLAKHPQIDPDRLAVAGYSFGGAVAIAVAKICKEVRLLVAISPVVAPLAMQGLARPSYFICGTEDHVVSTELLIQEASQANPPGQVEIEQGADHFWVGLESEMAGKAAAFLSGAL